MLELSVLKKCGFNKLESVKNFILQVVGKKFYVHVLRSKNILIEVHLSVNNSSDSVPLYVVGKSFDVNNYKITFFQLFKDSKYELRQLISRITPVHNPPSRTHGTLRNQHGPMHTSKSHCFN